MAIWLGTHGMAVLAEEMVALVAVAAMGCFPSLRGGSAKQAGELILINIDDRLIRSSIWNHAIDSLS